MEWYQKAVTQGNAAAQYHLGVCYEDGKGVAQDDTKAVEWYQKAAAQGHASAKSRIKEVRKRQKSGCLGKFVLGVIIVFILMKILS